MPRCTNDSIYTVTETAKDILRRADHLAYIRIMRTHQEIDKNDVYIGDEVNTETLYCQAYACALAMREIARHQGYDLTESEMRDIIRFYSVCTKINDMMSGDYENKSLDYITRKESDEIAYTFEQDDWDLFPVNAI